MVKYHWSVTVRRYYRNRGGLLRNVHVKGALAARVVYTLGLWKAILSSASNNMKLYENEAPICSLVR